MALMEERMKLADEVLVEIVDIVRTGLVEQKDISDLLRDLDLQVDKDQKLVLTEAFKSRKGRVT
jgi:hypothetical protein